MELKKIIIFSIIGFSFLLLLTPILILALPCFFAYLGFDRLLEYREKIKGVQVHPTEKTKHKSVNNFQTDIINFKKILNSN
jgi:hypothetical protein